jgi:hypothetical protein
MHVEAPALLAANTTTEQGSVVETTRSLSEHYHPCPEKDSTQGQSTSERQGLLKKHLPCCPLDYEGPLNMHIPGTEEGRMDIQSELSNGHFKGRGLPGRQG